MPSSVPPNTMATKRGVAQSKPDKDTEPESSDGFSDAIARIRLRLRTDPDPESTDAKESAQRASAGDTEAARAVLEAFAFAVECESEKSWNGRVKFSHADYVARAIRRILRGEDAALALGIKTSNAGRRPGTVVHDPEAIAAVYYLLRRGGYSDEMAKSTMKDRIGASDGTIRAAKRQWRVPFADKDCPRNDLVTAAKRYSKQLGVMLAKRRGGK